MLCHGVEHSCVFVYSQTPFPITDHVTTSTCRRVKCITVVKINVVREVCTVSMFDVDGFIRGFMSAVRTLLCFSGDGGRRLHLKYTDAC